MKEANNLNSPDLTKLATSLIFATVALTCPPRKAEIISVLPPNGTWVTWIPASFAKWAAPMWLEAPAPLLEIVNSSGWAFAYSTKSAKVLNGLSALTTNTPGS